MVSKIMIHEAWYHKVISFFRARGHPLQLEAFLGWGVTPKITHFCTKNRSKIPSPNNRPMVPKVAPMGVPAEPKMREKVENTVSESPWKSDAGKNCVSDRLEH